jgi:hypothetical protein
MIINIISSGIELNGILLELPFPVEKLTELIGEQSRITSLPYNHIFTWDELGIYAHTLEGEEIHTFNIQFLKERQFQFAPSGNFSGTVLLDGEELKSKNIKETKTGNYNIYNIISPDDILLATSISLQEEQEEENTDKYIIGKPKGEIIHFTDFNFKLAVIDILMYEKELLDPVFDLYEFARLYKGRKIDIEKEGYNLIPEVTKYFEDLPVEKKYAPEITEIIQDGGNDIYGQLCCFWDGEDDLFNIKSFEDIKHFPNLKRMELFYTEDKDVLEKLQARGIEASFY